MKKLILLCVFMLFNNEITIVDFKKSIKVNEWYQTNDSVMGGISTSNMIINNSGVGIFKGSVSTENNGGFAMTRLSVDVNLKKSSKNVILRVKGDGKKYQFRIKSRKNQRYWYVKSFQTSNKIEEIVIPLKSFYASFRGYKLNIDNFSESTIKEIAVLIGNKKNEEFKLTIEKISIN